MNLTDFKFYVKSDLYRYYGKTDFISFIMNFLFNPGFKYTFWIRTCKYLRGNRLLMFNLYFMAKWMLSRCKYKYGIDISHGSNIGPGLYIAHFGQIFISYETIIGKNCNLSQGVSIGVANRGKRKGHPILGDNVYVGPGAKIFGKIVVGNGVAIGANCVVTSDVPENGVVVGVPGKVISYSGSIDYVNNKV
jgi:serine O-acetyltransferase